MSGPTLAELMARLRAGQACPQAELAAAAEACGAEERRALLAELEREGPGPLTPLRHALLRAEVAYALTLAPFDTTLAGGPLGAAETQAGAETRAEESRRVAASGAAEVRIGPYVVERLLGEGGMGRVCQVVDAHGRRFALKTLRGGPALSERAQRLRARFAREAELGARLSHPGIQAVYGAELEGERPYLVVELLGRGTLAERLDERGSLSLEETLAIGLALTRALRHAHGRGVVHRDLKPENVLFRAPGQPVLVDFGLAVSLSADTLRLTRSGEILGTPAFMAPEQATGGSDDPATDAYALGGLLYVMLSGEPPLDLSEAPNLAFALATLMGETPPPLREARPDAPPELERLVAGLLSKEARERPGLDEVEQTLSALAQRAASGSAAEPGRRVGALRLGALRVGAPLVALALGLALAGALSRGSSPPRASSGPGGPDGPVEADPDPASAAGLERLREAVAAGRVADALGIEDAGEGSEARFLRAWSLAWEGRAAEAERVGRTLAEAPERWRLLARTLSEPPDFEALESLAELYPECPYAATRRGWWSLGLASEEGQGVLRALERRPEFVPLWLVRAWLEGLEETHERALASLARARELSGLDDPPPGAEPTLGLVHLARKQEAVALEAFGRAAQRWPGRWHVVLGAAQEVSGQERAASATFREGIRLNRASYLEQAGREQIPTALRLQRLAGLPAFSPQEKLAEGLIDYEAARAWRAALTRWIPSRELRRRLRATCKLAIQGAPWRDLAEGVERGRAELGADPRWWELEYLLQASRDRFEPARALLDRLEAARTEREATRGGISNR